MGRRPLPDLGRPAARCPVAHSDRYGGVWLPTRHEDVSAIAYDTDHFSSRGVVVAEVKPQAEPPIGGAPPITSDPPFHAFARRLLLPAFAPRPIQALEPVTRQLCRDLLDRIGDAAECDAAVDYAQDIPPAVIARMLGLPPEDDEHFRGFIHDVLESITDDEEAVMGKEEGLDSYLDRHIADHVEHPRDDLISYLLDVEIEGTRLSPEHVRGTVLLLLIAGIDTTWSAIGAALWHLAAHADDRHRLAAEPELMGQAVEELLRAYAPVTMARIVAEDTELGGRRMAAGDWVLLPFPAANRDPEVFEDAGPCRHRPRRQPPRRVRSRHPPLPRVQPRPHGADRRPRGVDGALPGLRAGRPRRRHVVGRAGPRPSPPARAPPRPRLNQGRPGRPDAPPRSLGTEAFTPSSGFRSLGCTLADATMVGGSLEVVRRPRRGGRRRRRSGPRPGASRR